MKKIIKITALMLFFGFLLLGCGKDETKLTLVTIEYDGQFLSMDKYDIKGSLSVIDEEYVELKAYFEGSKLMDGEYKYSIYEGENDIDTIFIYDENDNLITFGMYVENDICSLAISDIILNFSKKE